MLEDDAAVDALILDLLEWVGPVPRPNDEVMEVWRTSCPRLPVSEDANDRGFIVRHRGPGPGCADFGFARRRRPPAPAPLDRAGPRTGLRRWPHRPGRG